MTKVSITFIKTENVKYLKYPVLLKNCSFFKIIQNPAYSGHFFSKSSNDLLSNYFFKPDQRWIKLKK
jgi:hypothetical protein